LLSGGLFRRDLVDRAHGERLFAEHLAGANHSHRLWALLVLELWLRLFVDRTLAPGDKL
jgi:hypothetical protein